MHLHAQVQVEASSIKAHQSMSIPQSMGARGLQVEASSIRGGIGLVKVMGRHSGFLAMQVGCQHNGKGGRGSFRGGRAGNGPQPTALAAVQMSRAVSLVPATSSTPSCSVASRELVSRATSLQEAPSWGSCL